MNYEQFKSFNNVDFLTSDNEWFYVKTKTDNMSIFLYQNESAQNVVNKTLTNALELKGTLRESCDILNPSIMIENKDNTIFNYNYVYIPDFKRYYYINDFKNIINGLYQVNLKVDVLMSFKNDIKNLNCVVIRQANKDFAKQTYTPDDLIPYTEQLEESVVELDYNQDIGDKPFFDNKASNPYTVLKVMGGAQDEN